MDIMVEIKEGNAIISIPEATKVSKEMEVFYNPVMKSNRDISVLLLKALGRKMRIADIMAASGIRSIRFMLETGCVEKITINDISDKAINLIKENLRKNNLEDDKRIILSNKEANTMLLESPMFDYIDIDPFGTPNNFLDTAVKRIKNEGILAVTATDTSALAGTYENACKRKYWAKPLRNELMHEVGLRILIRKIQLIGVQYEKALLPIFSYSKDHYMRVFLKCLKGKGKCDEIIKKHEYLLYCRKCLERKTSKYNNEKCSCGNDFDYSGKMWVGELFDNRLAKNILGINSFPELAKFLEKINEESKKNIVGFFDLHKVCSHYKIDIPRTSEAIKRTDGFRTHFSDYGIKSELSIKDFISRLK